MESIVYAKEIPVRCTVDVFVGGGGPAGTAAAIAAGRAGCSVFLAESTGCLGGMGTAGMVPLYMPHTDGEHELCGGIGREIMETMRSRGGGKYYNGNSIDLELLKAEQNMADVDDFDFICHVAFDKKPLTRKERANNVKKRDFFSKYSGAAREVLEALLDKYMNTGIYEIEKTEILKLDPFIRLGKPAKIASYFGGKQGYLKAVEELEQAIYTDEVV